jgi:hypothetical protein
MNLAKRIRLFSFPAIALALGLALGAAWRATAAEPTKAGAPAAADPSAAQVEQKAGSITIDRFEFRDASLREAAEFLRQKGKKFDATGDGVNVVVNTPPGYEGGQVNLSMTNVPLSDALRYVAEMVNLEAHYRNGAVVIEPAGATPTTLAPNPMVQAASKIVIPKLEFRDAKLDEALAFLRQKTVTLDPQKKGINIVRIPAAGGKDPGNEAAITLSLEKIPVTDALIYCAEQTGYTLTADDHAFILRPKK